MIDKQVDVGQLVNRGELLARLSGTDSGELRLPIKPSELSLIAPAGIEQLHNIQITLHLPQGKRMATVNRIEGQIDEQTRVYYLIANIDDPYLRQPATTEQTAVPLAYGQFIETTLTGPTVDNVYEIPLHSVQRDQRVYVVTDDSKLELREIELLYQNDHYAYVTQGLNNGDQLVTARLNLMYNGMPVTTQPAMPAVDTQE